MKRRKLEEEQRAPVKAVRTAVMTQKQVDEEQRRIQSWNKFCKRTYDDLKEDGDDADAVFFATAIVDELRKRLKFADDNNKVEAWNFYVEMLNQPTPYTWIWKGRFTRFLRACDNYRTLGGFLNCYDEAVAAKFAKPFVWKFNDELYELITAQP